MPFNDHAGNVTVEWFVMFIINAVSHRVLRSIKFNNRTLVFNITLITTAKSGIDPCRPCYSIFSSLISGGLRLASYSDQVLKIWSWMLSRILVTHNCRINCTWGTGAAWLYLCQQVKCILNDEINVTQLRQHGFLLQPERKQYMKIKLTGLKSMSMFSDCLRIPLLLAWVGSINTQISKAYIPRQSGN